MKGQSLARSISFVSLCVLAIAVLSTVAASGQCVDSSVVNNFKVRSVKLEVLFGLVPIDLRRHLALHRGESYSAEQDSTYEKEVTQYLSGNPVQQKYEQLIANNLKLSASARLVTLECVEPLAPDECQSSFAGDSSSPVTQCVDVTLKAYSVDIDVLNSSPFILPLPRSTLAALYGAIQRPLLLLNPGFNVVQDAVPGPAVAANT